MEGWAHSVCLFGFVGDIVGYTTLGQVTFLEVGEESVPIFVDEGGVFLEFPLDHKFLISPDVNDQSPFSAQEE